jgi:FKBP-type peptidyl-prolyl cis-trans isomerase SlpA
MTTLCVDPHSRVTLHFALKFEDGAVIDSTFEKDPATFTFGDGSLPVAFEKKVLGMQAGQQGIYTLLPEEGFGQSNSNNIQHFFRKDFDKELELIEGLVISFADSKQSELPGVIKSVDGDNVLVDFNHPLAGQNLVFEVDIISVETDL